MSYTTIQLDKDILKQLKNIREYPRQTYNDLIKKLISMYMTVKQTNQYDEFLHKVQQEKMKELWDNPVDEVWNDV
jgi:hypothetical protein